MSISTENSAKKIVHHLIMAYLAVGWPEINIFVQNKCWFLLYYASFTPTQFDYNGTKHPC